MSKLCLPKPRAKVQQRLCVGFSTGAGPGIGDSTTRNAQRPLEADHVNSGTPVLYRAASSETPTWITFGYCPEGLTLPPSGNISFILPTPQNMFLSAKLHHMPPHIWGEQACWINPWIIQSISAVKLKYMHESSVTCFPTRPGAWIIFFPPDLAMLLSSGRSISYHTLLNENLTD